MDSLPAAGHLSVLPGSCESGSSSGSSDQPASRSRSSWPVWSALRPSTGCGESRLGRSGGSFGRRDDGQHVGRDRQPVATGEVAAVVGAVLARRCEASLDEPADGSVRGVLGQAEDRCGLTDVGDGSNSPVDGRRLGADQHFEHRPRGRTDLAANDVSAGADHEAGGLAYRVLRRRAGGRASTRSAGRARRAGTRFCEPNRTNGSPLAPEVHSHSTVSS